MLISCKLSNFKNVKLIKIIIQYLDIKIRQRIYLLSPSTNEYKYKQ